MPSGLQIRNDYSTIQIDENWKNYGFKYKFPVTLTLINNGLTDYGIYDYRFTVTGSAVLVAFRSPDFHVIPRESSFDGVTWAFNWRIQISVPPFVAQTATVEFYIFDVPTSESFSNVGIEVFNAVGERVFHSDMGLMRIPSGAVQACNFGFTGVSGRIYAPLIILNPIRAESGRHWTRSLRVSAHTITTFDLGPLTTTPFSANNEGLYAAIDVTGL